MPTDQIILSNRLSLISDYIKPPGNLPKINKKITHKMFLKLSFFFHCDQVLWTSCIACKNTCREQLSLKECFQPQQRKKTWQAETALFL